jgi:DNA-binding CsgD family transcriptional regulator
MSVIADKHFNLLASKLQSKHSLKEKEVRLCVLTLIGMSRADIADTLPYAVNSVGKLKDETAKKLGTTGKNLHDFLLKMAVEG